MVRLVFRPYTQIRRTICTSVSLRASTRVSPGFALFKHRSPSFGSQRKRSYSYLPQAKDTVDSATFYSFLPYGGSRDRPHLPSFRIRVLHPNTCAYVGLLGPCFKTGHGKPFRQHPECTCDSLAAVPNFHTSTAMLSKHVKPSRHTRDPAPEGRTFVNLCQSQRRVKGCRKPE